MKRDYPNAIKSYEKAKKTNPGYLSPYVNMAQVYMYSLNNYKAAEKVLQEGLWIAPTSQKLLYNMGILYLKTKQGEKARQHFLRTVQLNDSHAEAHTMLGVTYEMEQDYQKALTVYIQAAATNSKSHVLYGQIGNAYIKLKEFPEAREALEKALELNPSFAGAHVNIGETHLQEGELHKAISHYRKAIEIDPDDVMPYNNMGVALAKMQRWDESLSYYEKAIGLKPDYYPALKNKVDLLFSLKKYWESVDGCRTILEFYPRSTDTWYRLAIVYEKLGMPEKAGSSYARLSELDPSFAKPPNNNPSSTLKKAEGAEEE
jgi:tetratricopeptide (TPR) repeat protein